MSTPPQHTVLYIYTCTDAYPSYLCVRKWQFHRCYFGHGQEWNKFGLALNKLPRSPTDRCENGEFAGAISGTSVPQVLFRARAGVEQVRCRPQKTPALSNPQMRKWRIHMCYFGQLGHSQVLFRALARIETSSVPPQKTPAFSNTQMRKWRIHRCYFGHWRIHRCYFGHWRIHRCYFGHWQELKQDSVPPSKNSRVFQHTHAKMANSQVLFRALAGSNKHVSKKSRRNYHIWPV